MSLRKLSALVLLAFLVSGCSSPNTKRQEMTNTKELGSTLSGGKVSEEAWAKKIAKILPSIVRIKVEGCGFEATGTGFVLDGLIVTNRHVIEDAKEMVAVDANGKHIDISAWHFSTTEDIAILTPQSSLPKGLRFAAEEGISGDLVATGGYPLGGPQVSNRGRLVSKVTGAFLETRSETFVWSTNAEVLPGDSGGPLLDRNGDVIGVVYAMDLETGLNLAIPLSRLKQNLLERQNLQSGYGCK